MRKALVSASPKIMKQLSGRVGLELKFKKVFVKSQHTQKSRKHRKCFSVELMNAKKNGEREWAGLRSGRPKSKQANIGFHIRQNKLPTAHLSVWMTKSIIQFGTDLRLVK